MAISNQERIGRGLELLGQTLEPRAVRSLETVYGPGWWDVVDRQAVEKTGHGIGTNLSDPYVLLTVMSAHWMAVFGKVLGKAERNYVGELLEVRNRWAHPKADKPFSGPDTERALDTMSRLAAAVGDPDTAAKLATTRQEVLRATFETDVRRETRRQATLALEMPPVAGLRPWREVIEPHPDVAGGRYALAEFMADLGQVAQGKGSDEYRDPRRFYERTYLTRGLSELLVTALQRLSGSPEGDPVVELQTSFGGGKTHSMLALFHLVSGAPPTELAGVEPILERTGMHELPTVRRVVLGGTVLSPAQPRRHDGIEAHTLWGDLACQLGGAEAYERLRGADEHGVSPGSDILCRLVDDFGPALILIDEWVTFIRQLWADPATGAGSFDANLTFAQSLTEAVRASKRSMLVASLPSSDIEKGGEGGQIATQQLKHVVGRVQSPWRPASTEEGFEIVRRRLFGTIPGDLLPARDATIKAFGDLYASGTGEFPADTKEAAYGRRMTACYPVHPELFDQLFGAWSSLERFQQTRGVLRLMSTVIHALWERGDRSPLILPSSIPIDEPLVQSELTRYLEDQWNPVIEHDVDGEQSVPLALDRELPALGKVAAARRVARTIYVGSAPTAHAATRGVDDRRIKLGCVAPGETPGVFGDALRRLSDRSTYLYENAGRYWYSTQPSVNRLARDRAAQLDPEQLDDEIRSRLRREHSDRGPFARVHPAPRLPNEVPDEDEVALVILGPEAHHSPKSATSRAVEAARLVLDERGTGPRKHRNMLVFLAPDTDRLGPLREAFRSWLAWRSIDEEREALGLDPFQLRQVETKRKEADETIAARIPEAFRWLLVPTQTDAIGPVTFEPVPLSTGPGSLALRAGTKLRTEGSLIVDYGGESLRLDLDTHPAIWQDGHVDLRRLWELYTTYVYLPRLRDSSVLLEAIRKGTSSLVWQEATFAYASGYDAEAKRYRGLAGGRVVGPVLDGSAMLVKPEMARAQMEADAVAAGGGGAGGGSNGGADSAAVTVTDGGDGYPVDSEHRPGGVGVAERSDPAHFHGTVTIRDSGRPSPEFSAVAEHVIAHLAGLSGANVSIRVEIDADRAEGFGPDTIRVVTENVRTLKFEPGSGFED